MVHSNAVSKNLEFAKKRDTHKNTWNQGRNQENDKLKRQSSQKGLISFFKKTMLSCLKRHYKKSRVVKFCRFTLVMSKSCADKTMMVLEIDEYSLQEKEGNNALSFNKIFVSFPCWEFVMTSLRYLIIQIPYTL